MSQNFEYPLKFMKNQFCYDVIAINSETISLDDFSRPIRIKRSLPFQKRFKPAFDSNQRKRFFKKKTRILERSDKHIGYVPNPVIILEDFDGNHQLCGTKLSHESERYAFLVNHVLFSFSFLK